MDVALKWFESIDWTNIRCEITKNNRYFNTWCNRCASCEGNLRNAFRMGSRSPIQISERRTVTVAKLLENIVAYVVMFIMLIAILGVFDINASGLLAGAGVIGLAVGFGAQSLVKDVITGLFILLRIIFSR